MCRHTLADNDTPDLLKVWDWQAGCPGVFYSDQEIPVSNSVGSETMSEFSESPADVDLLSDKDPFIVTLHEV